MKNISYDHFVLTEFWKYAYLEANLINIKLEKTADLIKLNLPIKPFEIFIILSLR